MKKLALSFLSFVLLGVFSFGFSTSALAEELSELSYFCLDGFVDNGSFVQCSVPVTDWDQACVEIGGAPSLGLDGRTAYCDINQEKQD